MAESNPFLVELEERLSQDRDGTLRARLVAELKEAEAGFQTQMRRGGRQEDFQRWMAAMHALNAAVDVLQSVRIPPAEPAAGSSIPSFSIKGA